MQTAVLITSSRAKRRWVWPRVKQLLAMLMCAMDPQWHVWGRWRRETEDWFEYTDAPLPWSWRCCHRCWLMEHVRPLTGQNAEVRRLSRS